MPSFLMTPDRIEAARALLSFYLESGVDALVGETPLDRLSVTGIDMAPAGQATPLRASVEFAVNGRPEISPAPPFDPVSTGPMLAGGAPAAPDIAVMAAREAARTAASLSDLREILAKFEGCALRTTAKQLVFADGNPQARVMFVGEAPGREEDLEGLPFVGRSGKLLDLMMAAIGLNRTTAYIANIIPWRPPGNRTPTPQESQICLPFIRRQIELANPDVLVCMGGPASQALLSVKDGIKRTRGRWFDFHTGTREIRAIATFHPAFLLRSPLEKRFAWRDFLAIKKALAQK
jgi:uracil-DNA glycosylase family 4